MTGRTMRAAILTGPGTIELTRVPLPHPGPGEVRVALEGCGVCASNLEPFAGQPWLTYPGEPGGLGHEGWGTIDAIGAGVTGLAHGQRVATLSGRSYAEYDIAPVHQVLPLPGDLALPVEPFACAMNVAARADIVAGQWVAVIGAGFIGAVVTRLAAQAGARVIAISRRASSRALARTMGAEVTIPMDDHWKIIEAVKTVAGEDLCPRVIECAGAQWPLDLATELVGFGGKLVIAGYHQDGPRQVNMQTWNWKGIDVINAHERDPAVQRRGAEQAIAAVAQGRIDPGPLLTHKFGLDELPDALAATRDKPEGFVKAVIQIR
jgi:threonine dehydrogenase-like Zn-dependent dehydrogenase